jgi:hypothetical protein
MQNGGLAQMLNSHNNPYTINQSIWSGGGVTGTSSMQFPGMMNSKIDPYAPLSNKQLNHLYSTGKYSSQQMPGAGMMAGAFPGMMGLPKPELEDDEVAADDEEDMGVIETYSNYWPVKLKVGFIRKFRNQKILNHAS